MDKLTYMYEYPIEIAQNFYSSIVVIIVELMGINKFIPNNYTIMKTSAVFF